MVEDLAITVLEKGGISAIAIFSLFILYKLNGTLQDNLKSMTKALDSQKEAFDNLNILLKTYLGKLK